jgi:hypothetical protein
MKRWIRWAAWLYPALWRTRYSAEFEALLDDAPLRWGDLADVVRGALLMQMTNVMTYGKMALLVGLAGALLVGGYSFTIPNQYVSTAALMVKAKDSASPLDASDAVGEVSSAVLTRDHFVAWIASPRLDLYPKERQRESLDDIAENVFPKHLRLQPYDNFDSRALAFRVIFQYPDPYKAKAVVETVTEALRQQLALNPSGLAIHVLESPVTPVRPTSPMRGTLALLGALLGLVTIAVWRRTRVYAVVTVDMPMDTKQFADRRIAAGEFRNMSEYVRALIRADQQGGR